LIIGSEASEIVKVLGFSSPLWKRGAGGDFITEIFYCNINELLFCKIPLNPPFPKGEAKSRILSQSLQPRQAYAKLTPHFQSNFFNPLFNLWKVHSRAYYLL